MSARDSVVRVLATIALLFLTSGTAGAMYDAPHPHLVPACCWLLFVALLFLYYLVVRLIFRDRPRDLDNSPEDRP